MTAGTILLDGQPALGAGVVSGQTPPGNLPIIKTQVSLTDPFTAFPEWVDVTPWAQSIATTEGRQHELQQSEPATCKVTLDNRSGLFDQWSTASPYCNQLAAGDASMDPTSNADYSLVEGVGGAGVYLASATGTSLTTLAVVPQAVGDALILAVEASTTQTVTSVSGGGATWQQIGVQAASGSQPRVELWLGTVTAVGSATVTVSWSSAPGVTVELSAVEISAGLAPGVSYRWAVDTVTANTFASSATTDALTATWPRTGVAEVWVGYGWTANTPSGFGASSSVSFDTASGHGFLGAIVNVDAYVAQTVAQSPAGVAAAVGAVLYATSTTWAPSSNCSVVPVPSYGYDNTPAVQLTATGSGTMAAETGSYPAAPGEVWSFCLAFAPITAGVARQVQLQVQWLNSGGGVISTTGGNLTVETAGGYVKSAVQAATAPAGTASYRLVGQVVGCGAGEVHAIDRAGAFIRWQDTSLGITIDNIAWGPAGVGIGVARTVRVAAQIGATVYPLGWTYINAVPPTISSELERQVQLQASDVSMLLANALPSASAAQAALLADGPLDLYLGWAQHDQLGSGASGGALLSAVTPSLVAPASWPANYEAVVQPSGGPLAFAACQVGQIVTASGSSAVGGTSVWGWSPQTVLPTMTGFTLECWVALSSAWADATVGLIPLVSTAGGFQIGIEAPTPSIYARTPSGTTAGAGGVDASTTPSHVAATFDLVALSFTLYVNGVAVQTLPIPSADAASVGTSWTIGPPQSAASASFSGAMLVSSCAIYGSVLSAQQVAAHAALGRLGTQTSGANTATSGDMVVGLLQALGIPGRLAALSPAGQIAAGTQTLVQPSITAGSSSPAIQSVHQIEQSELGFLYQRPDDGAMVFLDRTTLLSPGASAVTLENTPTSVAYLPAGFAPTPDDTDLWNHVVASGTASDGSTVTVDVADAASVVRYGQRTYQGATSLMLASSAAYTEFASVVLAYYSAPRVRVRSVKLTSRSGGGSAVAQMAGRRLNDTVTVVYNPANNSSTFQQLSQIERIAHTITPADWTAEWQLTPAYTGGV